MHSRQWVDCSGHGPKIRKRKIFPPKKDGKHLLSTCCMLSDLFALFLPEGVIRKWPKWFRFFPSSVALRGRFCDSQRTSNGGWMLGGNIVGVCGAWWIEWFWIALSPESSVQWTRPRQAPGALSPLCLLTTGSLCSKSWRISLALNFSVCDHFYTGVLPVHVEKGFGEVHPSLTQGLVCCEVYTTGEAF